MGIEARVEKFDPGINGSRVRNIAFDEDLREVEINGVYIAAGEYGDNHPSESEEDVAGYVQIITDDARKDIVKLLNPPHKVMILHAREGETITAAEILKNSQLSVVVQSYDMTQTDITFEHKE